MATTVTQLHTLNSIQHLINKASESESLDIPLPPPTTIPTKILHIDEDTPDSHVPRDPRLIRLTGVHPFNVEAPLTELYNEGFLTSPELFYVRNHGAVPKVLDKDIPHWELSIEGLVANPITLSFKQILEDFNQITAPITLVCAGNRRKEQNVVRKSNGFSWGAGGLSTALFTGPLMADLIRRAKPLRKARYVCMEGADKLPNGNYGTSVKLNWVMDPNRCIMLAHKMNGESLRPDHGRPLRAVIPGQIGGRSVKWLKKLIITDAPSKNWYHIYDNRVLPTMVSPEIAKDPKWWYDERYAIYDLSVNSAAAYPQHNEELQLTSTISTYKARGYAYGGGGRRITRVEISLDKGREWRLADIEYAEDKYRGAESNLFGGQIDMSYRETSFCWCFWSLDIPIIDLETSDSILVRAMDESMNLQPRDMYWSVLGMMNNPWFRVTITKKNGFLKFEHPAVVHMPGGWMERVKKVGGDLTNGNWGETNEGEQPRQQEIVEEINMKKEGLNKEITIQELKHCSTAERPWFVVKGEVYDGTGFLAGHPGGSQSIISAAGMDATEDFLAIHSESAKAMMKDYHIGTLNKASQKLLANGPQNDQPSEQRTVFLDPKSWSKAFLLEKKVASRDTGIFTFKLNHSAQTLGLPIGQHLMLKIQDSSATNRAIIRAYTPISATFQTGTLDLLVKIYSPTLTTSGGKMTTVLDALPLDSVVEFKGPIGKFEYRGRGTAVVDGKLRAVSSFHMICGGSGVTPIFQVLRAVMQDPADTTSCVVLYGNRQAEDILCKEELDGFAAAGRDKCTLVHTLSKPSGDWMGRRGRIDKELLNEFVVPKHGSVALICGPEAMEKSVRKVLLEMGWKESNLVFF